jgi:hypothetical protein
MNDSFYNQIELRCCEMQWYVLSTKSNYKKQAEQMIQSMGVGCFLPLLEEQTII